MLQWVQDQDRELGDLRDRSDMTEWRREVKEEIEGKANLEDVKQTLDHVAESMEEKVSRSDVGHLLTSYVKSDDLLGELETRPTKAEVNRWLDHKAEESELRQEVQKLNEKIDRMASELSVVQATAAGVTEVAAIRERLEKKLDADVFKETIKKLVTFEELHEVVSKKADFEEIEEILQRKVDGDDLNQVISILEKKADSELVEEMIDVLKNKAEARDLELVTVAINKKSDRLQCEENTSHIAMIRKEVESLFEELDHTFADVKKLLEKNSQDLEACSKEVSKRCTKTELTEVRQIVARKVESSLFLEELSKLRDDQSKEIKSARTEAEKVLSG
jgi:hypothetical protein